jgi:hypothetical protein
MLEIRCNGCKKEPEELPEYVLHAQYEGMTPTEYVIEEEGTYNPENGHFLCTACYMKAGSPSMPFPYRWIAP